MKKVLLATISVALLLAACGDDPTLPAGDDAGPGASPIESSQASPGDDPAVEEDATITLQTWFTEIESLHLSYRTVESTKGVGTAAMQQLLAGPGLSQEDGKIETQIPAGTELLGLDIDDGIATVDLSSEFESGGGSASMRMRVAQVVFTLTQFSTIEAVSFAIDGRDVDAIGGEGVVTDPPVTRRDFKDLMPPITVASPSPDQEVSSPVTISGTANVFEANVSIRIVDADGKVLAKTFTTASCGTGCRGDYSTEVEFSVGVATDGFVEVYQSSPEDGRPMFVVRVPVHLLP